MSKEEMEKFGLYNFETIYALENGTILQNSGMTQDMLKDCANENCRRCRGQGYFPLCKQPDGNIRITICRCTGIIS